MIRYLPLWLLMFCYVNGFAQQITVSDSLTNRPLANATISGNKSDGLVISNADGLADVSALKNNSQLVIRMMGYETRMISWKDLEKMRFHVMMVSSVVTLREVVVSSYKDEPTRFTSLHIEPLYLNKISQQGTFTLSNALAKVPGVTQLSSGVGISKPVIRGLFGNRILVLFSGLRFDNQQWQDEHGLGLGNTGFDRVEVIKGPLSLLYGTEAVGGVINIIEEKPAAEGSTESDAQMDWHSNTLGGSLQAGTKTNFGNHWYRLRLGITSQADYSDGNNQRVLNSRFNGSNLMASYGFKRNNWTSDNHYHFSFHQFGFIFGDIKPYMEPDNLWSRNMAGPHHKVLLNMLSSINRIQLPHSLLKINAGLQSNFRMEDEGGGEISLVMHLVTGQYNLKWEKQLNTQWMLVLANNSSLEQNANYGKRKIVPDAWMEESAFSAYAKRQTAQWVWELAGGSGIRGIQTLLTPTVNSLEKDIAPFSQVRFFANGMAGFSFFPQEQLTIKANVSSGVRAPNLAELSSNGLHEGIYTYEIGDPDMGNEQNLNGELSLEFAGNFLELQTSAFYNYFFNYIYLDPTNEEWFGFPVYRFRQHAARIYGNESVLSVKPV